MGPVCAVDLREASIPRMVRPKREHVAQLGNRTLTTPSPGLEAGSPPAHPSNAAVRLLSIQLLALILTERSCKKTANNGRFSVEKASPFFPTGSRDDQTNMPFSQSWNQLR